MKEITSQPNFTPVALIVLLTLLVIGFLVGTHIDRQRLKRRERDKYPSAKRKYPMIVDAKLDLDVTESFYSEN